MIKIKKNFFQNILNHKISTFNFCCLGSVILHKLSTSASSDQHNSGMIRHSSKL